MPRPKGSLNRSSSRHFKELIERQVAKLGVAFLDEWARDNPGEFYKIASKMIPQARELSGPDGQPIQQQQLPVDQVPRATNFTDWYNNRLGGESERETVIQDDGVS
mgnify:CR=1 FL=1